MEDLMTLKRAMWDTAQALSKESSYNLAKSDKDKLGCTMAFIRAAEKLNVKGMARACSQYPALKAIAGEGDPNTRVSAHMQKLKEHAAMLAKREINDKLSELSREQENVNDHGYQQKKTQILTKLKRLIPGASTSSIGVIQNGDHMATTAEAIARQLQSHWERTFNQPPPSTELLGTWLDSLPNLRGQAREEDR